MLRFYCCVNGFPRVKPSLVRRRKLVVQISAVLLFHSFDAVTICKGQSASSPPSDTASRATTIYKRGLSALQKGDLDSARTAFETVVRLAPQSPEGHNSLGWVLLARDQVDPAISQFQKALTLK